MATDSTYVNGVIAAREKYLLKDKILRMSELGPAEAFRMLLDSGFGAGESVSSVYEYEKLIEADEAATDRFIREYAPSKALMCYLMEERDFHNAKAYVKAAHTGGDVSAMLSPEGMIPLETIAGCFKESDFSPLPDKIRLPIEKSMEYLSQEDAKSYMVGAIFDKALYLSLIKDCRHSKILSCFIQKKADMQNILSCLRSDSFDLAKELFVPGGKIGEEDLEKIYALNEATIKKYSASDVGTFLKSCVRAKEMGLPFTDAEKELASFEESLLYSKKYDLKRTEPFLYYILRRRAENMNVRVVFVCLLNGMSEKDIKSRLRAFS